MRSYDEAFAAAREQRPFSNGTEGYGWMGEWCDNCVHDRGTRDGTDEKGCPLVMVALMQRTPAEWIDGPRDEKGRYSIEEQYHCTEFVEDDEDGGEEEPEPQPRWDPEMPGQTTIFEVFAEQFATELEQAPELADVQS